MSISSIPAATPSARSTRFSALTRWKLEQSEIPGLLRRAATSQAVQGAVAPFVFGMAGGIRTAFRSSARGMGIRFAGPKLRVEQVERFGPEFDALWERLKRNHAVTTE
jgi:hypothetical protein